MSPFFTNHPIIAFGIPLLILSAILPIVLRPILHQAGRYDIPNDRSSHLVPTLRGGGVSNVLIAIIAWLNLSFFLPTGLPFQAHVIIGFSIALGILGIIEDFHPMAAITRLLAQFALSLVFTALILILNSREYAGGLLIVALVILFGCVWTINAANFMDGIHGVSSITAILAAIYTLAITGSRLDTAIAPIALIVLTSFAGFLPWNFPRPQLFLGDSGSYFLGAAYSAIATYIFISTWSVTLAIAPMLITLTDSTWTLAHRFIRHQKIMTPHKEHVFQRLQRRFASHTAATFLVFLFASISALIGIVRLYGPLPEAISLSMLILLAFLYCIQPIIFKAERIDWKSAS
ncbi:MAG: hypothetical protein Q4P71_03440 [Actinomycetaceae bacterium]|nr:hypothetical protein [Actinomycetaceae bacterium]